MTFSRTPSLLALVLVLFATSARADVRVPSIFGDHMVLQQEQPVRIWGWAEKGESVTVSLGGDTQTATAADSGRWQVELPPRKASNAPATLRIQGKNTVVINDVLVGEVWLCSGQSNMEWTVAASADAQAEIAAAQHPLIRHIKVPLVQSNTPLDDFQSTWQICSPETAGTFTACGYFLARRLQQELGVPVGLVNASWGGTRIEPWTPPVGFQSVAALQDIYRSVIGRTPGTPQYRDRLSAHIKALDAWVAEAKSRVDSTEPVTPSPAYPAELAPFTGTQDPTMLYNGMIHPLVGFAIRGAIWYQGESNHGEGMIYVEKKKALINGWRTLWGQGDFPFYYVQIAPFQYGSEDPEILAQFWEAQAACQSIPKTGMVVINDIATVGDIHPPNKQDVGFRLASLALKNDYGQTNRVANSPEVARLELLGNRLKIHFKNTGGGLKTRDEKAPSHFEVIGVGSNGYKPATATIEGDTVVLSSDAVQAPLAFRFAWHMLAEPNLVGGTGLPVGACRGGDMPDFFSSVPTAKQYTLVYDLDLRKLGRDIAYDVDKSGGVNGFDRVGYLLELTTAGGTTKSIFVSMNAFTDDVKKIGIPTVASKAMFQQPVSSLDVFSNVDGVNSGTGIATGNIEFWPDNYGMANAANVAGASTTLYDFGDERAFPEDGYGSMQVHNFGDKQTLFSINHWTAGDRADIGIGNGPAQSTDWTFAANAGTYTTKRLRVFVRPTSK